MILYYGKYCRLKMSYLLTPAIVTTRLAIFPPPLKPVFCINIKAGFCLSIRAVAPLTADIVFAVTFPIPTFNLANNNENAGINYIQENPNISEVILSGGDPLLLSDVRLAKLFTQLSAIKHLKRIRIHTRLPIVLPARITDDLINTLTQSSKQIVIVVHCNHANEINPRVIAACQLLKNNGIILFNQSVLLKGVNDNPATLCELSEQLFSNGIIPYYLHLLDKATGTGHFEVSEIEAINLIKQVQATLPGYLVPKLVKELAGALSKQSIQ